MTDTIHTAGRWEYDADERTVTAAAVTVLAPSRGDREVLANGSLMAAAPDLLAALKLMVQGHSMAWEAIGRAAIAKAEGR